MQVARDKLPETFGKAEPSFCMILSNTESAKASESVGLEGVLRVDGGSGEGSTSDLVGFFGRDDLDFSESGVATNLPVESRVECLDFESFLSKTDTELT